MKYNKKQTDAMFEKWMKDAPSDKSINIAAGTKVGLSKTSAREKMRKAASGKKEVLSKTWLDPEKNRYLVERAKATWEDAEIRAKRVAGTKIGLANRPDADKAAWKANIGAAQERLCTIDDGVTVYPSLSAMAAALGWGKNGARSPNFRYLDGKPKRPCKRNKS